MYTLYRAVPVAYMSFNFTCIVALAPINCAVPAGPMLISGGSGISRGGADHGKREPVTGVQGWNRHLDTRAEALVRVKGAKPPEAELRI